MSVSKQLVWLHGVVKSPPFSTEARLEAGYLLWRIQEGESLGLPHCRPMPSIGSTCCELRVNDKDQTWRIVLAIESDAVVILEVFSKKKTQTPQRVIDSCKERLRTFRSI